MNVANVKNNATRIRKDGGNVGNARNAGAAVGAAGAARAVKRPQGRGRGDAYIPSAPKTVSNALYDVADVRGNGISRLGARIREGMITPSGEKISRKVVEILLPTGRKSLTIYKKQ